DRRHDPCNGRPHVGERQRIVQLVERWTQESRGQLRIVQSALTQEPPDHRRDLQRAREPIGGRIVAANGMPTRTYCHRRARCLPGCSDARSTGRRALTKDTKGTMDTKGLPTDRPFMTPNGAAHAVIGCAMRVHTEIGSGALAVSMCMLHEMRTSG